MGGSLVVMGIALMGGVVVAFATSNASGQTTAAAAPTSQPTTAAAAAVVPPPPIVSTAAAPATAPATAPAVAQHADWAETMNRLATLLAGKDLTALVHALEPAPVIRVFANDTLQTPERLLGHTTGSKVLGVHAYDKIPTTLATDLAEDFQSAGDAVPENIRQGMTPSDAAAAKRSNESAGQWLAQVLQPAKGQVMGVIILWPEHRGRSLGGEPKRATFVLVKASLVDGKYALRQITFGDPLETPHR
jgi:hypothetical protein